MLTCKCGGERLKRLCRNLSKERPRVRRSKTGRRRRFRKPYCSGNRRVRRPENQRRGQSRDTGAPRTAAPDRRRPHTLPSSAWLHQRLRSASRGAPYRATDARQVACGACRIRSGNRAAITPSDWRSIPGAADGSFRHGIQATEARSALTRSRKVSEARRGDHAGTTASASDVTGRRVPPRREVRAGVTSAKSRASPRSAAEGRADYRPNGGENQ